MPMHRLFAFADRRDAAMMTVGALAAVVNGLAMPFLTFLIGDLVDSFGAADRTRVVHVVSKVWSPRPAPALPSLRPCCGGSRSRPWMAWCGGISARLFLALHCCLISCACLPVVGLVGFVGFGF